MLDIGLGNHEILDIHIYEKLVYNLEWLPSKSEPNGGIWYPHYEVGKDGGDYHCR